MDDPYDLVLGMFGVAIAAVMLVAGELYLVMRPDPPGTYTPPSSVVTSSIDQPRAGMPPGGKRLIFRDTLSQR
jgi:hypothetical protein